MAVGTHLEARGPRIDGVVMPGLIDTHWHMGTSLYRSMSSSNAATAYFALDVKTGVRCRPSDLHHGAHLLGLPVSYHADSTLRGDARRGDGGQRAPGEPLGRHPADGRLTRIDPDAVVRATARALEALLAR